MLSRCVCAVLPPPSLLLPPPSSPLSPPPPSPSSESAQGWARHHSESDPTRPMPAEGSPASSRMGTAPQRERSDTPDPRRGFAGELKDGHGTTARALRHARSPQRVHRRAQGWARHHSESAPTRPIPAEGSSASSRMGTAPQRERSDTPDPRRGFIGELKDGHGTTARALRHARSPRGFIGELKDGHGTTARALRHARSPQRVHRARVRLRNN